MGPEGEALIQAEMFQDAVAVDHPVWASARIEYSPEQEACLRFIADLARAALAVGERG